MNTLGWIGRRPNLMRIMAVVAYFAGITGIVGWSSPDEHTASLRDELAVRPPDTRIHETTDANPTLLRFKGSARNRMNCEECGIIESVSRIDSREAMMPSCTFGDGAVSLMAGNLIYDDDRLDVMTLADTAAAVTFGDRRAKKFNVSTRHQIVVRLRDGSKQVFDEKTPRTLRVGDRIQVIAGATGANG
jgi:hypothetical protein